MIKTINLTKKYGDKTVVDNLNLEIKEGYGCEKFKSKITVSPVMAL